MEFLYSATSNLILQAFYSFKNKFPLELALSFFKSALVIEMEELGLQVEVDKSFEILHKQKPIGFLQVDCIVNNEIAIKVVATPLDILEKDINEMKSFLRLTTFEVGLVLNFGSDGEHKRVLLTNDFKRNKG
jgi:GxxExxY protein